MVTPVPSTRAEADRRVTQVERSERNLCHSECRTRTAVIRYGEGAGMVMRRPR